MKIIIIITIIIIIMITIISNINDNNNSNILTWRITQKYFVPPILYTYSVLGYYFTIVHFPSKVVFLFDSYSRVI